MHNSSVTFSGLFFSACRQALQWRLLLLWLAALLLAAAVSTLPFWRLMAEQFDYNIEAASIARQFSVPAFADLAGALTEHKLWLGTAGISGVLLALLCSPLLSGMALTAGTAAGTPGNLSFGALLRGGAAEYGRMARLLFWSLIPMGIAAAAVAGLGKWAENHAGKAILATDADFYQYLTIGAGLLLFGLMHTVVEAARADFALDSRRRSGFKAIWRGVKLVWRRPFAALGLYAAVSVLGLGLALPLVFWRTQLSPAGLGGFLFAFILTQLLVALLAWTRCARLFALIRLAQAQQQR